MASDPPLTEQESADSELLSPAPAPDPALAPAGTPPSAPSTPSAPSVPESAPAPVIPNRLHPSSILFLLLSSAKSLILPGIFLLFAARGGSRYEVWAMIFIIPYTFGAIFRYLTYRYAFHEGELVIRTGVLFRNQRHIPYSRIHNIGSVQNPLHRMLRVAEVRVETAGGQEPEASLKVLSVDALEEMRQHIRRAKASLSSTATAVEGSLPTEVEALADSQAEPQGEVLLHMSPGALVLHGLIDNRGMLVVGAFLGLLWQLGLLDRLGPDPKRLWVQAQDAGWMRAVVVASAVVVTLVIGMRLLSIAWSVVKLWGYRLRKVGREVHSRGGLLTQVSTTLPLHRIQVLTLREKILHRLLDRLEVTADTAGGSSEGSGGSGRQRLAPLITREALPKFLAEVEPGVDLEAADWQRIDPRATTRLLRRGLFLTLPPTVALVYFVSPWTLVVTLPMLALVVFDALRESIRRGYACTDDRVFYRSGWWSRRISLARYSKIQAVSLTESPFDRRWRMCDLQIDTAGAGSSLQRLHIRYLPADRARELRDHLAAKAAQTKFRW